MERKFNILNALKALDVFIATTFVLFAFLNILLQIMSRITPGRIVHWTVEMGEILLVAIIWMGIGAAVVNNNHIRFDMLLSKLPHKIKKYFYVAGNAIFAGFLIFLARYAVEMLQMHIRFDNRTPALLWSRAAIRLPVLAGCAIGSARLLIQAYGFATGKIPLPSIDDEIQEAISDAAVSEVKTEAGN